MWSPRRSSPVEVVATKLHAGAKFGNASYNAAGGLHGVGSSVVNALSSRLDVEVDRNGHTYHMAFHQGHPGVYTDVDPLHPSPDSPFKKTRKNRPTELEVIGKVPAKTTGTRIRYWADPEIFNASAKFDYDQLIDRVRQTSFRARTDDHRGRRAHRRNRRRGCGRACGDGCRAGPGPGRSH